MLRSCLVLVLFTGGCVGKNPRSCDDGVCSDPTLKFCDADGSIEGTPLQCIAVSCAPGEFFRCHDGDAWVCADGGDTYKVDDCEFACSDASGCTSCVPDTISCVDDSVVSCDSDGVAGTETCDVTCADSPQPHCAYLEPQYLPTICDELSSNPDPMVDGSLNLNTNMDANCSGGVVLQTGGPDLCVLRSSSFTLASAASLRVQGARGLAIVTDQALSVAGLIDVSADGQVSGTGGGTVHSGGPSNGSEGGGGAGFGTFGGNGGNHIVAGGAANGGQVLDPSTLSILVGGTTGNGTGPISAKPGGGGGALALISCRGVVNVSGTIDAGGGGGDGGGPAPPGQDIQGGGGGGAGGHVVMEGVNVVVTGKLFANGGGGGAGKPSGVAKGQVGNDARPVIAASGGTSTVGNEGAGGSGGFVAGDPTVGGSSIGTNGPGGGGGSVGWLFTYTPEGVIPQVTPTQVSPNVTSKSVPTR